MNFILPFNIPKATQTIGYNDKILCLGSCFAEEIGDLMQEYKLDVLLNPHGIIYNSLSIARSIDDYLENKIYTKEDLVYNNNLWHSLNHHGSFSDADLQKCLDKINSGITNGHEYLKNADWLCVTLGSSWVYHYKSTDQPVANCHKVPQENFTKELIQSGRQYDVLSEKILKLRLINPQLKFLFTVSPVKYIRDGIIENNLSKAQLISTVHSLCDLHEDCFYFPAYELVTDILRGYRFYKEDMVHPNEQAVKFVWEHFVKTFLKEEDSKLFDEIGAWLKYSNHRPLSENDKDIFKTKSDAMESAIEKKLSLLRSSNN